MALAESVVESLRMLLCCTQGEEQEALGDERSERKEARPQNGRITHSRAAIETRETIAPAYDEASSAAFLLGTPSSLPISYSSFDEHRSQSTARN